ncbi:MAG: FG-GAP-like repeat-containing protein [Bacteroidota bacterium]|nr:FG-GAP-like repeat-containing protein [Bacteroidota bacterium]
MKPKFKLIYSLLLIFSFYQIGFSLPINQFINTVAPQMNANSVNKSSNITIVFTQDMNASLVNGTNIKVFGYQTGLLPVTIDYNSMTKTANINPNVDFKVGEKISLTLTTGLQTVSNQSITPFVYSFIVQAIGGNGYFTKTSSISSVNGIHTLSGDIDRDGKIDLVVNNKVYKNNGNAVFSFFTELSINGIPELADFDSDGDLDILIENSGVVYFFRNDGNGIFTQTYSFNGYLENYGDLTGNGFLDISCHNSVGDIEIIKNNNGIFISDTSFHFSGGCAGPYKDKTLIADLHNDGYQDVIGINGITGGGIGPVLPFLCRNYDQLINNNMGIFSSNFIYTYLIESSTIVFTFRDSKSFDYNNDGYIDIISPGLKLRNNGNATYSYIQSFGFSFSLSSDFNGDGFIDIVSSINYFQLVPLFTNLNDGAGNFVQAESNNGRFINGTSADFDNDGDIDVAAFDNSLPDISILLNGDVPFPAEFSSFTSSVNSNTVSLRWTTTSEENNSGFEIERSIVNAEWSKINFIEGSGNSNSPKNYSYDDRNLSSGKYKYRLKQIDFNGNYKYYELHNEVSIGIPGKFELLQNYPNPFNPSTKINYSIRADGIVTIKIYDVNGKEVQTIVNEFKNAGYYSAEFKARDGQGSKLASGVYYYRMEAGSFVQTKKMLLLK